MTPQTTQLTLWTGPKHAGKTTALADLVECARPDGFSVAGLLSLARYRDGNLLGFEPTLPERPECGVSRVSRPGHFLL